MMFSLQILDGIISFKFVNKRLLRSDIAREELSVLAMLTRLSLEVCGLEHYHGKF